MVFRPELVRKIQSGTKTMTRRPVLTESMRNALSAAARQDGLRRVHDNEPGRPPWPAPHQTLHALERHGMLERTRIRNRKGYPTDVWRITDAGRAALNPPARTRRDSHQSMAAKGDATSRVLVGGVWQHQRFPEPEKVASPGVGWVQRGKRLQQRDMDPRKRATAVARKLRAA